MTKRLYRSRDNQMIAGVCAGLAEYFAIDPVIIRIAFVLLSFAHGLGILLYIVLWLLVPEKPLDADEEGEIPAPKIPKKEKAIPHEEKVELKIDLEELRQRRQERRERSGVMAGLLLVALGAIFLIQNFVPDLSIGRLWPILLLALGLGMVWKASRKL